MTDRSKNLEIFFSQSLDGFFFMMLDEPLRWDETTDKDSVLDYVLDHQRITKLNEAMAAQYGARPEQLLGLTPRDLYRHDPESARVIWRKFLDRGRLHVETDERRLDGTPIAIEGDYICFYDEAGLITGHFGIQRDVTERKNAEASLRMFNRRLGVLQQTAKAILSARSPREIAQATLHHIGDLIPCTEASVLLLEGRQDQGMVLALQADRPSHIEVRNLVPLSVFGKRNDLERGKVRIGPMSESAPAKLDDPRTQGTRSAIIVPLLAHGELVGVLSAASTLGGAFTAEHVEIAQEFANHLAVSIQQAVLLEATKHHAADLEKRVAERTAELRRSENRLRAIIHAIRDMVFVMDEDGTYVEVLAGAEDPLHPAEGLRGKSLRDVFDEQTAQAFLDAVRKTIASERAHVLEYSVRTPAGTRWLEGRTALLSTETDQKTYVVLALRDVTDRKRAEDLETQNIVLREELTSSGPYRTMVGESAAMKDVFSRVEMVAETESTVLLLGETGTGKELLARAIHEASKRRNVPMVKVNCGAFPSGLVESELFGHEKGSFTGATQQKKGRFELAQKGTLFLDEIGELPLDVQVKLLRVLQEREFERVGGTETIRVEVRLIAATNRNLDEDVRSGAFRADLYYRLNVFPIEIPPLRERKEDIALLANQLVSDISRRIGKRIESIEMRALERLGAYPWPGNVRELANILERAVILCRGKVLLDEHVGLLESRSTPAAEFQTLEQLEREHIIQALERTGGVVAGPRGAARLLGLNRSTLWSRMKRLGIQDHRV